MMIDVLTLGLTAPRQCDMMGRNEEIYQNDQVSSLALYTCFTRLLCCVLHNSKGSMGQCAVGRLATGTKPTDKAVATKHGE